MRRTRMIAASATLTALLGAVVGAGSAGAASPTGVGTSKATDTILNVALGNAGSLLNVRLLGDDGSASIDPAVAKPSSAASSLTPAAVTSSIAALNQTIAKQSVQSTGANQSSNVPTISLTSPAVAGLPAGTLLNGSITPAVLTAGVDATGAKAGLNTTLKGLSVVSGLLSAPQDITSNLGANALTGASDGTRGLNVPSLQVLNLGELLQGLGIDPNSLTLGQVSTILDALATRVSNGGALLNGTELQGQVTAIQNAVTDLNTAIASASGGVVPTLPANLNTNLTTLGLGTLTNGVPVGDVQNVLDTVNAQLVTLLNAALGALTAAPLLEVDNVVAGLTTKAADTVANSVATVSASIGAVKVGSVSIPTVDLGAAVTQLTDLINNQVLGTISSVLKGAVTVKLLDQNKGVTTSNGYTHAVASLTAVHVGLAPVNLTNLVGAGQAAAVGSTVGSLITGANGTPLALDPGHMGALNDALNVAALTQGASVDAVKLSSTSDFAVAGSTPGTVTPNAPPGTLALTGSGTQVLGLAGLLLLALGATARWLRRRAMTA